MKKITGMVAAASAVVLATTGVPAAALAAPVDAAQVEPAAASQPREAKTWYVRVLESHGGDGSEADPFSDFADAYRSARDGDTIVVMNTATVIDDDDGRADGFFAMDKSLTITGYNGAGGLSVRPALVLGADVTFDGIELNASSVSLNGHALTMVNVKNYTQSADPRPTVYGGKANGITENPARAGQKSVLTVEAPAGTTMELQGIYAGSQSGDYAGDVEINLTSGATVLDRLSADGAAGKVTGSVDVNLGATKVFVEKIVNQRQAGVADRANLNLAGFSPSNPIAIAGFDKVNLTGSNVKVDPAAFENNGAVVLDGASTLDASSSDAVLRVESFDSKEGALVKLATKGVLGVEGVLSGSFELRTDGLDSHTSGPVSAGHAYVTAGDGSAATVAFKPYFTQLNFRLVKQQVGQAAQWVAHSGIDKPLAALAIEGENRIEIKGGAIERTMTFADAAGAPLAYTPDLVVEVEGPDGDPLDSAILDVVQDDGNPALLRFEILDDSMAAGTYTLTFTDIVSGAIIEKPFEFFKNDEPAPGPGGGEGGGTTDPDPNPGPGGGEGGGQGGGMPDPEPEPEPEPAPQPGTPDAPTAPPAIGSPDHENACPGTGFGDVDAAQWYHEAVDYVTWNKIMTGTSETTFEPESTTTRAMTAMVLWRMAGAPEPQGEQVFSDVEPSAWYAKPIAWAAENGIAHGYGDTGAFGPEDEVTREQLATFLMRLASLKDFDTSARADLSEYGDAADIGAFAQDALSWGTAQGLFRGMGDTMMLAPQNDSTRAQMAMVLMRFCQGFMEQ